MRLSLKGKAIGGLINGGRVGCWPQDFHFLGQARQGEYLEKLECASKDGRLQIWPTGVF